MFGDRRDIMLEPVLSSSSDGVVSQNGSRWVGHSYVLDEVLMILRAFPVRVFHYV